MKARCGEAAQDYREAGFTLIELLIAILLFALLSTAAAALLSFAVDARGRTGERLDTLAAVTRSRALLAADIGQAAARPWRDARGSPHPALTGREGDSLLILVRRGWRNDGGTARASLQRVEYRLVDGRLERRAWPLVDGAAAYPPAVLLTGVTALALRFHHQGQWQDRWDPVISDSIPTAVAIDITATGLPALHQVFLVGPGSAR
ncbi:MAG: type II secretion system minor pseudopilin GspJ [Polymorphobacter sp.]